MSIPAQDKTNRLAERTLVALQPLDINHATCAAGHTAENHLAICHECWSKSHHLKDDAWKGQMGCPMYLALVADNMLPIDPNDLDDITLHRMQAEHKRNYEGCALMACGLERYTKDLIADWRDYGKQTKMAQNDYELKQAHSLNEPRNIRRGRHGTISKEIFFENQPLYTVKGIGMGLNGKPFAKVRMTFDGTILYVELHESMRKNNRRKFNRELSSACHAEVSRYLSH